MSPPSARPTSPCHVPGRVLLALACLGGCGERALERSGRPRSALLISIDTLRPDHLGCYGHERPTSPNLDALAHGGVRFADVTSAAPWTLPSHATMLTGLYPSHHGVKTHETRLSASVVTLAEEFQRAGFATFAAVNTHNVGAPQFQLDQGFEHFRYIPETVEDPLTLRLLTPNTGAEVVAAAQGMLARHDAAQPYFLFLHFYDVHTDFTPSPEFKSRLVGPYDGRLDGRSQQLMTARNRGRTLAEDDLRWLREMYDAEILQFDDLLGRFLAWLEAQGLAEDTLIVITSDHGEEFQEHGGLLHGRTQYQEVLRVPLLIHGPGIPKGSVIETAVHGIDVTPTMLGIMGVESTEARDGIDLSRGWRGEVLPQRDFFAEADHNNLVEGRMWNDTKRMLRRGAEKLIADSLSRRLEYYNLVQDPLERNDLAAQHPKRAQELARELELFAATAVTPEVISAPTPEEQRRLDAMGYGGGDDDE